MPTIAGLLQCGKCGAWSRDVEFSREKPLCTLCADAPSRSEKARQRLARVRVLKDGRWISTAQISARNG